MSYDKNAAFELSKVGRAAYVLWERIQVTVESTRTQEYCGNVAPDADKAFDIQQIIQEFNAEVRQPLKNAIIFAYQAKQEKDKTDEHKSDLQ